MVLRMALAAYRTLRLIGWSMYSAGLAGEQALLTGDGLDLEATRARAN